MLETSKEHDYFFPILSLSLSIGIQLRSISVDILEVLDLDTAFYSPALLSFPTSILLMEVSALTAPPRSCKLQDGPRGCPNGLSTGYIVYIYIIVYIQF